MERGLVEIVGLLLRYDVRGRPQMEMHWERVGEKGTTLVSEVQHDFHMTLGGVQYFAERGNVHTPDSCHVQTLKVKFGSLRCLSDQSDRYALNT